jgi:hypothetical protein
MLYHFYRGQDNGIIVISAQNNAGGHYLGPPARRDIHASLRLFLELILILLHSVQHTQIYLTYILTLHRNVSIGQKSQEISGRIEARKFHTSIADENTIGSFKAQLPGIKG